MDGPEEDLDGPKEEINGPVDKVDGPEEEDIIGNLMKVIREGKALRRRSEAQSNEAIISIWFECKLNQDDTLNSQKLYEQSSAKPRKVESKDTTDGGLFSDNYRCEML